MSESRFKKRYLLFLLIAAGIGASAFLYLNREPAHFTKENPWSVKVCEFRSESDAENAVDRLRAMKIPAYIVSRSPSEGDIWHSVQVGAFKDKAEAEKEKDRLQKMDLTETSVVGFENEQKNIALYDKTDRKGRTEASYEEPDLAMLSDKTRETMRRFPVDENFKVVSLVIGDLANMAANKNYQGFAFDSSFLPPKSGLYKFKERSSALTQAVYQDKLFGYRIGVTVVDMNNPDKDFDEMMSIPQLASGVIMKDVSFGTEKGNLKGNVYSFGTPRKDAKPADGKDVKGGYLFIGRFSGAPYAIVCATKSMTQKEFVDFIRRDNDEKGLLFYPEVRSNLTIIPAPSKDGGKMTFLHYSLGRIGWNYAVQRNRAWWARMVVGNWQASGTFIWNDRTVSISFFNLNYNATAGKVHANFVQMKQGELKDPRFSQLISERKIISYPQKMKESVNGWYYEGFGMNELSFSRGAAIIAIGSYDSRVAHDDLMKISERLRVW